MTSIETSTSPQKRILLKCLLATLGIHIIAFLYFYKFPPGLPYAWHQMFVDSLPILRMVPKENENNLLEEVFEPFPELSFFFPQPYDMVITNAESELLPQEEHSVPFAPPPFLSLNAPEAHELPLSHFAAFSFEVPSTEELSLALPDNLSLPIPLIDYNLSEGLAITPPHFEIEKEATEEDKTPTAYPQKVILQKKRELVALPQVKVETLPIITEKKEALGDTKTPTLPLLQEPAPAKPLRRSSTKSIASTEYYSLPEPKTTELLAENIEAEIRLGKSQGKKGHLFTITLKPSNNAEMDTMSQNYTFLIDRSNSIQKHHFAAFKKATLRALSMLQPEDTFNIVVFDKKAVHFSKKQVFFSKDALESAESFLNKQQAGGLFAAADLYEFLPRILPTNLQEDEVNTVILLTDGTSDAKPQKQHAAIKRLIESSKKKLTLYTAAVGNENNLKLLELISGCTGGSLLYSDTFAAFPRRLAGLVYRLRSPLIKEVTVSALGSNGQQKLFTLPSSVFYSGQPFEIVGTTENLEDFTLLIEGIHEGEGVRLKKKISFVNAKKDSAYVNKKWGMNTARLKYENQLAKK